MINYMNQKEQEIIKKEVKKKLEKEFGGKWKVSDTFLDFSKKDKNIELSVSLGDIGTNISLGDAGNKNIRYYTRISSKGFKHIIVFEEGTYDNWDDFVKGFRKTIFYTRIGMKKQYEQVYNSLNKIIF